MSWARIPLGTSTHHQRQHHGVVAFQRWWGAARTRSLTNPAVGVVHSALVLERLLDSPHEQSSSAYTSISQFTAGDWHHLFAAALSPEVSSPLSCHTFVISDWKVFEDSKQGKYSSSVRAARIPPFPIFNIVARRPGDFAYNNHIYDAIRNSFGWDDSSFEQKLRQLRIAKEEFVSDVSCRIQNDQASMVSAIEEGRLRDAQVESCELHTACSVLPLSSTSPPQIRPSVMKKISPEADCNETTTILDELAAINLSDEEDSIFYFYPFESDRRNIAYQNDNFFVIVNLKPVEKAGHLLVIPRRISGSLFDCFFTPSPSPSSASSPANLNEKVVQDCADAITKAIKALNRRQVAKHSKPCDGFSIVVQQGKCAGQTVAHVHLHIIALTRDEGLCSADNVIKSIDPDADKRSAEELEEEERIVRQPRGSTQMIAEAQELKAKYFL